MAKSDLLRRLAALETAVRPNHSLAARVERLSPSDRQTYEHYRTERAAWSGQFLEPDGAYRAFLNGDSGPQLPHRVAEALFGQPVEITRKDSNADAAEKFREFLEKTV